MALKYFNYMTHMCALMMLILMMIWQCSHKNDNKRAMHTTSRTKPKKTPNKYFCRSCWLQCVRAAFFLSPLYLSLAFSFFVSCRFFHSRNLVFFSLVRVQLMYLIWTCLHSVLLLSWGFWRRFRSHMPYIRRQHLRIVQEREPLDQPNSWNDRLKFP